MSWLQEWRVRRLQVELAKHVAEEKAAVDVYTAIGKCSPVWLIREAGKIAALRERIAQLEKEKP